MSRIIDIHAHIWKDREKNEAELMRRAADAFGVERILVSALGRHTPDKDEITYFNSKTEQLIKEDSLFGGYVTVSPEHDNSLDVLRRGIESQGFLGMKIWVSCLCDEDLCDRLYEYCADNKVPVLVHTFAKAVGQLPYEATGVHMRNAALKHPDTKFIMAHLGGNCYHGLPLINDLQNVWVDISGSVCRRDDLPYALELLGSERILFGTDMPGSFAMSYGQVLEAELEKNHRDNILWKNAVSLFGL